MHNAKTHRNNKLFQGKLIKAFDYQTQTRKQIEKINLQVVINDRLQQTFSKKQVV